ncbi:ArpU family phage packaging/lysis transcriptional regulator [Lactobacillus johnsonii]|uniref:ArpU family phage packaging/lysis transcriptional regulator n=1 Tax=Lactobacillus johnsonii TaxID=33959 RepID=UPI001FB1FBF9|nr:ArpU family phage packaging/lysis transcriptional regulator [Lactobacillus johnsonii]UOC07079.1 hypothetical protein LC811_04495 [Lactobacillus johnsonii]
MTRLKDEIANNTHRFFINKLPELLALAGCHEDVLLSGRDFSEPKVNSSKKNSAETIVFRVDSARIMLDSVKDALYSMDETYRKIIQLCYLSNLRNFEIAGRLGYSERTVNNYKPIALKTFAVRFVAMQLSNGIDEKNIIDLTKTKEVA